MRMKKGLALLLVLCLALAVLPVRAYAAGELHGEWENLQWTFDEETGTLTISGEGEMPNTSSPYPDNVKKVIIESGITSISELAFAYSSIEEVTIPDTVKTISNRAFYYCENLKQITVPASVETIEYNAFVRCGKVFVDESNPNYHSDDIGCLYQKGIDGEKLLHVPSTIEGKFSVPQGVKEIDSCAFAYCTMLSEVILPDGLENVWDGAFQECDSLQKIELPNSVTTLGEGVFYSCDKLQTVVLSSNLTKIGEEKDLIGPFLNCISLQNIDIPQNVRIIGRFAFCGCVSLTDVVIPENVEQICDCAFTNCKNLKHISIPETTVLGQDVFLGCTNLEDHPWTDGGSFWKFDSATGTLTISGEGETPDYYDELYYDYDYPCPWQNYKEMIRHIVLEEGITGIGKTFGGLTNLESVTIPDTVTSIDSKGFNGCEKLELHIPKSVVTIKEELIGGSGDPVVLGTPSRQESFRGVKKLIVDADNPAFSSDEYGVLYNKDKTELMYAPTSLEGSYAIPNGVITIGSEAFADCKKLTEVIIPDSVTKIERLAFYNCVRLNNVTLSNNLAIIGDSAFRYCAQLNAVTFPDTLTEIGIGAFHQTALVEVDIPEGASVGSHAFSNCPNLKKITWFEEGSYDNLYWKFEPDSGTLTISGNGDMTSTIVYGYPWSIYSYSNQIKHIILEQGITSIGNHAFESNGELTEIEIPDSVTAIGVRAFAECAKLTNVKLPKNLTVLSYELFDGAGLTSIEIPNGVTRVEEGAFCLCDNLEEIVFPASVNFVGVYQAGFHNPSKAVFLNPSCEIPIREGLQSWIIVYGYPGSTAEEFVKAYKQAEPRSKMQFIPLDSVSLVDDEPTAQKWNEEAGGEVSYHIDHPLETDVEVLLDGVRVDPANYVVTEGSTIVTFKESYLATLAAKEYEVNILFSDGGIETSLIVTRQTPPAPGNPGSPGTNLPPAVVPPHGGSSGEDARPSGSGEASPENSKPTPSPEDPPKTGDFSAPALWVCLMAVSGLAVAMSFVGKKKRK